MGMENAPYIGEVSDSVTPIELSDLNNTPIELHQLKDSTVH